MVLPIPCVVEISIYWRVFIDFSLYVANNTDEKTGRVYVYIYHIIVSPVLFPDTYRTMFREIRRGSALFLSCCGGGAILSAKPQKPYTARTALCAHYSNRPGQSRVNPWLSTMYIYNSCRRMIRYAPDIKHRAAEPFPERFAG